MQPYYNQDIEFLKHKFNIPYQVSNKSFTYLLAKGMLEVVNEKIEEFEKAMFWNVPEKDLNTEIKRVWEDTVKKIRNNEYDNLPKISESPILHVRPHARNARDTYPTLDEKQAIKKCFWLNASYIKQQIEN